MSSLTIKLVATWLTIVTIVHRENNKSIRSRKTQRMTGWDAKNMAIKMEIYISYRN